MLPGVGQMVGWIWSAQDQKGDGDALLGWGKWWVGYRVLKIWEEMEMLPWGSVNGGLDMKCSGPGRRWKCSPQGGVNGGLDIEYSGPGRPG